MYRYDIFLPSILTSKNTNTKTYPLLIYLHGFGLFESFRSTPLSFVDDITELSNFIIATPFSKYSWWDHSLLFKWIVYIVKLHPVDPTRVFLCGQSMGGFAIWSLISHHPKCFSAAIIISGGNNPFTRLGACKTCLNWNNVDQESLKKNKDFPIWIFHGKFDWIVPKDQSLNNAKTLMTIGNKNIKVTVINAGHYISYNILERKEIYLWLLQFKNSKIPSDFI